MRGGKKAQNPLPIKNANFLGFSPASQQVPSSAEPRGPRHSLGSGAGTSGPVSLQNLPRWSLPESLTWGVDLGTTVQSKQKKTR